MPEETVVAKKSVKTEKKPVKVSKKKVWYLENVQTRNVESRLNFLTEAKATIFSVFQSTHIGGSYEVLYYTLEDGI